MRLSFELLMTSPSGTRFVKPSSNAFWRTRALNRQGFKYRAWWVSGCTLVRPHLPFFRGGSSGMGLRTFVFLQIPHCHSFRTFGSESVFWKVLGLIRGVASEFRVGVRNRLVSRYITRSVFIFTLSFVPYPLPGLNLWSLKWMDPLGRIDI